MIWCSVKISPGCSLSDVEAETPILWPPDAKSWLIWKDPDAGKARGQEEKGTTDDEMVGWHHWLNGHGFGWTPGVGDGQGGLVCCGSWGRKEWTRLSDWTELNWTELKDWRQKKRVVEDEMDGNRLNGVHGPEYSRKQWRTGKPGMLQSVRSQSWT